MIILRSFIVFFLIIYILDLQAVNPNYCSLSGQVYIEESAQRAMYLVYEEESESFADLLVFEETNQLLADQPGIWFVTENIEQADFTIAFVKQKRQAEFSIFITEWASMAGCTR